MTLTTFCPDKNTPCRDTCGNTPQVYQTQLWCQTLFLVLQVYQWVYGVFFCFVFFVINNCLVTKLSRKVLQVNHLTLLRQIKIACYKHTGNGSTLNAAYKAAFLKICPGCNVLTCVSHGRQPVRGVRMFVYVPLSCMSFEVSTLQQGRHVNWSQRLPKGGASVNRLLPPATPKLSTAWQSVATNRSRIYRSAMWIQVHWVRWGLHRLLLCKPLFQDMLLLPPQTILIPSVQQNR